MPSISQPGFHLGGEGGGGGKLSFPPKHPAFPPKELERGKKGERERDRGEKEMGKRILFGYFDNTCTRKERSPKTR